MLSGLDAGLLLLPCVIGSRHSSDSDRGQTEIYSPLRMVVILSLPISGGLLRICPGRGVSKEGVFWPLGSDGEFLKAEASALPSAPALVAHTGIGWCSVKGTVLAL